MNEYKVGQRVVYIDEIWFERGEVLYVVDNDYSDHMSLLISPDKEACEDDSDALWVDLDEVIPYIEEVE